MKIVTLLLALAVTAAPLVAEAAPLPMKVLPLAPPPAAKPLIPTLGFGHRPCRDWTAARAAKGALPMIALQWALGYYSGYNAFAARGHRNILPTDGKAFLAFLDSQCRQYPNTPLSDLAPRFVAQLSAKPH